MEYTTLSRLSRKCASCDQRDGCNEKSREACALIFESPLDEGAMEKLTIPPLTAGAAIDLTAPLAQEVLIPHDYRDIKFGEGATATIDLEEIKRGLRESLCYCNVMQFGC